MAKMKTTRGRKADPIKKSMNRIGAKIAAAKRTATSIVKRRKNGKKKSKGKRK
ncbi:MAG: hypothetical protein HY364_01915 [Candidatus Aenigmarchaeota archaeon]|nr:hypothetical protein [Candidatus Aenigmarchaeota archaeon]